MNVLWPDGLLRVAAYCRVSTDKDDQLNSLAAQQRFFRSYIENRSDWSLVSVFADEGLSGTSIKHRPQFSEMIRRALAGEIDLIITKEVSRFARNTVDTLQITRQLKERGVGVIFLNDNIDTRDNDGEFRLTIMASVAQEESRSASENQKWRIQKMFEEGRPNTGTMLGYRLVDGTLQIVPEEAEIVKMIFADFLAGMGRNAIMKKLNRMGIPAPHGGQWGENVIYSVLHNEKYTGDMLLQKTYILDHISKKKIVNHGERPMYYVENSHEAIIDKETFSLVQQELKRRAAQYPSSSAKAPYLFTGLIHCGLCGGHFRRKIVNASSKYAKPAWMCSTFNRYGKQACSAQQIPESILIAKTSEILGTSDWDRETLLANIVEIQVPGPSRLIYVFRDGGTQEITWQNPSRRESWTEEMRQKAREDALKGAKERRRNGKAR